LRFLRFNSLCIFIVTLIFSVTNGYGQGLPIPIGVGVPGGGGGGGVGVPDIPTNILTDYPIPYANKAADYRSVYLLRAAEMGDQAGKETTIRSLFFEVEKAQQAPLYNFTIRMRQTDADSLTIPISDFGLQTVYGPITYVDKKGFNEHRFNVPFCWDGVSNIVVDICVQNKADDNSLNSNVKGSVPDTTKISSYHDWRDDGVGLCDATNATQPELYEARPLMYWSYIDGHDVDLKAIAAPYPGSFMQLSSNQTIDFTFQNYGCEPVVNPTIVYQWNDDVEVAEQWAGTINAGEFVNYTFQQPITAYNQGFNSLKVWTDGPNDVFRVNDTISKLVWVKDTTLTGLDYTGTEFWVAFMQNYDNGPSLKQQLFITSGSNTNVTISYPLLGWSTSISVLENQVVTVDIPTEVAGEITATELSEEVTRNGLLIQSGEPVSVYGYSGVAYTTDAFLAIPTKTIGKNYLVIAPEGIYNATGGIIGSTPLINAPAEFIVVATANNTNVTIIPSGNTEKTGLGDSIQVTLQRGETYLVKAAIKSVLGIATGSYDLSGSEVIADKQVSVLSGAQCAMMPSISDPNKCDACDHLLEQMTPTDTWGKSFYLTDFDYKPGNDILRIMSASETSTNITINGSVSFNLPPKGQFYDYKFNGNVLIEADAPVQVGQFCTGAQCEPTSLTDPFYTNIIPTEQWGNFYTFSTPVIPGFDIHYINIIKKGKPARVSLNSRLINPAVFTQVASSEYYAGKIRVPTGSHIITSDSLVGVYVYGFARAESYGYPSSGSFLRRINVDSVEVDIVSVAPACNQTTDGKLTADVWYGSAPFKYLWSTGDTTVSINNVSEGTYWVKVTDLYGYQDYDTVVLLAPDRLELTMGISPVLCSGNSDGMAWMSANGGSKPYTITWQTVPPSLQDTLFNIPAGWYTVKVVDKKGCEITDSVLVEEPDPIQANLNLTQILCYGQKTGGLQITASGGVGSLFINWPAENLTQIWNRNGMSAGNYYYEITDENNCRIDSTITIKAPTEMNWSYTNLVHDECEAGTGAVSLSSSGGKSPHSITWLTGETTWNRNGLSAGDYQFDITDANGCILTDAVTINTTEVPQIVELYANPTTCENGNGSAAIDVMGGDSLNYLIKWNTSPPIYGYTANNLDSGSYLVTVNDQYCSNSLIVNIGFVAPPEVTFNTTNPTCGNTNGAVEAIVSGGQTPYSYQWNTTPVVTANPLTNVGAGSYKVTVTDANCSVIESVNLQSVDGPQAIINTTNSNCNLANGSANISISGGSGNYTIAWNGAAADTITSINNLTLGDHEVMFDDGVCQLTLTFEVKETKRLTVFEKNVSNTYCGDASGTIEVGATNGSGSYQYSWLDTLLNTNTRQNLGIGTYIVYVNDGLCADSLAITVNDYQSIQASILAKSEAVCGQGAEVYAKVVGGNGNPIWSWSYDSLAATNHVVDVPPGNHYAKVQDGTCIDSVLFQIDDNQNMAVNKKKLKDAQCDLPVGKAKVEVNGGTGNYTVLWTGIDTSSQSLFDGMLPGKYSITVQDGSCLWLDTLLINNTAGPKLQLEQMMPQRCGGVNGLAEVSLSQGNGTVWWDIAPIEYQTIIKNKPSGSYVAYVSNGLCFDSLPVNIPYYEGPTGQVTVSGASCDDFNGEASVIASGGSGPYEYVWHTFPAYFDTTASNLAAGNYVVDVSDSVCTVAIPFNIPDLGSPVVNSLYVEPSYCNANNGTASVTASGGSGNYSFVWETNPLQLGPSAFDLAPGIYNVIVDDGFCTDEVKIEIEDRPKPFKGAESVIAANCDEDNGEIVSIPGEPNYAIKWLVTDSLTSWKITDLAAGDYRYVVYNEWCNDTFDVTVPQYDLAQLNTNIIPEKCDDGNGSVFISEVAPYTGQSSITWASGDTTFGIGNLPAGQYPFVWSDEYCEIIDTITIINYPAAELVIDSIQQPDCGWQDGFVRLHTLGGEAPVTGKWEDLNADNANRVNMAPGAYKYVIKDKYCTTDSVITLVDMTPKLGVNTFDEFCDNSNGRINVNVVRGLPPYTINWINDTTASFSRNNLMQGVYAYEITDSRGCVVIDSTTLALQYETPSYQTVHYNPIRVFDGDLVSLWADYPLRWNFITGYAPNGDTITTWPFNYQTTETGKMPFEIIYQSDNGCIDTLRFKLLVGQAANVYIPNAFTPDSKDDLNAIFKIYGTGIARIEGGIFDRWGERIIEFDSLDDFWDGTFKGKQCKSDVYAYRFFITDINGQLIKALGSVTLIR
jgi:gliding motility-associated-like protein